MIVRQCRAVFISCFATLTVLSCGDSLFSKKEPIKYLLEEYVCGGSENYGEYFGYDEHIEPGELYCYGKENTSVFLDNELYEQCEKDDFCYKGECFKTGDNCKDDCERTCRNKGDVVMVCHEGVWKAEKTCGSSGSCYRGHCEMMLAKPNIYLYPVETTKVSVKLEILGSGIVESIPEYNSGWEVTVTPDGLIDDTYTYLFYEAMTIDLWQKESGWVIAKKDLESFFRDSLKSEGFKGDEIEDFIEWWIPLLSEYPYYKIYPQKEELLDTVAKVIIDPAPCMIVRTTYVLEGTNKKENLSEPSMLENIVDRNGKFVVLEWGLVLLN